MKRFHVKDFSKGKRHVSYVIQIEDGNVIECSIPFCFYFNAVYSTPLNLQSPVVE